MAFSIILLLISCAFASESGFEFSYDAQNVWPGICVQGNENRQSPIDIIVENVEVNTDLIDLDLDDWNIGYDGVFSNTGDNVQFDPNIPFLATTQNHLGTYEVQQLHMHWGTITGEGSEHRVDSEQAELEIHFVQLLQGGTDPDARNYISVIAVLADVVVDEPIAGPWEQLNATAVQPYKSNISVDSFRFDQLLPDSLEYYFYEGSLTTPPCSETVAWFVLKNRITVPGAYLELLRAVEEDEQGTLLTFNFRMAQDIGDRTVMIAGAGPTTPATSLLALAAAIVLAKIFC